jgi:hypothetical protein
MPTTTILTRGVIYLASLRHMHSYIRTRNCTSSSPPVFSGIGFARSLVFCVLFSRPLFVLLSFCWQLCHLSFTDSAYPFRIFKLFLLNIFVFILLILTSNETKVLTHNDAYVTVHMWADDTFRNESTNRDIDQVIVIKT